MDEFVDISYKWNYTIILNEAFFLKVNTGVNMKVFDLDILTS